MRDIDEEMREHAMENLEKLDDRAEAALEQLEEIRGDLDSSRTEVWKGRLEELLTELKAVRQDAKREFTEWKE